MLRRNSEREKEKFREKRMAEQKDEDYDPFTEEGNILHSYTACGLMSRIYPQIVVAFSTRRSATAKRKGGSLCRSQTMLKCGKSMVTILPFIL